MIEYTDLDKANARIKELELVRDEAFAKIAELQETIYGFLKEMDKKES